MVAPVGEAVALLVLFAGVYGYQFLMVLEYEVPKSVERALSPHDGGDLVVAPPVELGGRVSESVWRRLVVTYLPPIFAVTALGTAY